MSDFEISMGDESEFASNAKSQLHPDLVTLLKEAGTDRKVRHVGWFPNKPKANTQAAKLRTYVNAEMNLGLRSRVAEVNGRWEIVLMVTDKRVRS